MMESAWRAPAERGRGRTGWCLWAGDHAAKKYVVWRTLNQVDWNAEFVRGDLGEAVPGAEAGAGQGLYAGGVKLPMALAEMGLIDEYEFVVHPRLAGHGPTPFAGLSKYVDLRLVDRLEFSSGAVAMRYEPRACLEAPAKGFDMGAAGFEPATSRV